MTTNERLQILRKEHLKKTLEQFGSQIGYSKTVISDIEHGRASLTPRMVDAICREYRVSKKWLLEGKGEVFADISDYERFAEIIAQIQSDEKLEHLKSLIMSILPKLTQEQLQEADAFAEFLMSSLRKD